MRKKLKWGQAPEKLKWGKADKLTSLISAFQRFSVSAYPA